MRFIPQQRKDDCGVACVAMLAGVSYATALAAFQFKTQKRGTTSRQIIDAMHALGFSSVEPNLSGSFNIYLRLTSLKTHHPTAPSIIKEVLAPFSTHRRFHWLVFNPNTGNVWDPLDKKRPPISWKLSTTMTHYIPFVRRPKRD